MEIAFSTLPLFFLIPQWTQNPPAAFQNLLILKKTSFVSAEPWELAGGQWLIWPRVVFQHSQTHHREAAAMSSQGMSLQILDICSHYMKIPPPPPSLSGRWQFLYWNATCTFRTPDGCTMLILSISHSFSYQSQPTHKQQQHQFLSPSDFSITKAQAGSCH